MCTLYLCIQINRCIRINTHIDDYIKSDDGSPTHSAHRTPEPITPLQSKPRTQPQPIKPNQNHPQTSTLDPLPKQTQANAQYEGRYLLGTSLARPVIAKKQVWGVCVFYGGEKRGSTSNITLLIAVRYRFGWVVMVGVGRRSPSPVLERCTHVYTNLFIYIPNLCIIFYPRWRSRRRRAPSGWRTGPRARATTRYARTHTTISIINHNNHKS